MEILGNLRMLALLCRALAVASAMAFGPACAQVLEIGGDGSVATLRGPAVTTSDGTASILIDQPAIVAPSGAVAMQAVGTLGDVFEAAAQEFGVNARLLHAVAWQESRFRQDAVSPKGAIGIMQLMPDTARGLGVDPRDTIQNVRGGAALLARLLRSYRGNVALALAAYNAGPGAVQRHGGIPPYAETRDYVARITQVLAP